MTIASLNDRPDLLERAGLIVIGAGAVGITMAVALARRGQAVTLLEAGPRTPPADYEAANAGPTTGRPFQGLRSGRMRAFGGTTRLWGGQLSPFDESDLASCDDSGRRLWPIDYPEFLRWVGEAHALLGTAAQAREAHALWQRLSESVTALGHGLAARVNVWLPQPDFTTLFGADLAHHPLLSVLTDAEVTRLRFADDGRVRSLEVTDGRQTLHEVAPHTVVLANGTFEIARQLLRAQAVEPACPFRDNRNVGRYFLDHLHGLAGDVAITDPKQFARLFDPIHAGGHKYSVKLAFAAGRPAGTANIACSMNPRLTAGELLQDARGLLRRLAGGKAPITQVMRHGWSLSRVMLPLAWRYLVQRRATTLVGKGVRWGMEIEQLPAWDSYLYLDPAFPPETAPVGVHWHIAGREMQSVKPLALAVQAVLRERGIGDLALDPRILSGDPAFLDHFHSSSHYMGGARMGERVEDGVVDLHGRVFGSPNLYVAGAATFPTGSFANSTLSALALGLRLADHLARSATHGAAKGDLIARLVFGCGRLTGGVTHGQAVRLLTMAFDAGVRAIDVAPSYGLGTAEYVVGDAVRQHPGGSQIEIITKVGLPRPALGRLKTGLRALKRALRPPQPRLSDAWLPIEPADRFEQGAFDTPAMERSAASSRQALGRIDALLLHGCGPAELTPQVEETLARLAARYGARPGYAVASRQDAAFDRAYPASYGAECAIDPAVLAGKKASSARPGTVLHSLVPTANYLARTDPAFARARDDAAALLPGIDRATARIAAVYALAAVREPDARFVFASADPSRLSSLLAAFAAIDRGGLAAPVASVFSLGREAA